LTHILYPPNVFVAINIIQKVQVCVYFFIKSARAFNYTIYLFFILERK